jgi:RNA polymerase sigma-B factor
MTATRTNRRSDGTTPGHRDRSWRSATSVNHAGSERELATPATTEQLLLDRDELPPGHPDRAVLRTRVIEANLGMARRLAGRYAGRGESLEDLVQVAALALIKAVDGYDSARKIPFGAYAVPTIDGSMKRHFRDAGWGIRVPRHTQEMILAVRTASGGLTQRLGRTVTPTDLAEHLHIPVEHVLAAKAAQYAYRPASLDAALTRPDAVDLADVLGSADPRLAAVDDQLVLRVLVRALTVRERRILTMRFYDYMTQTQIAAEVGVSQMQVSRLLKQTLGRLRTGMSASDPSGSGAPTAIPSPSVVGRNGRRASTPLERAESTATVGSTIHIHSYATRNDGAPCLTGFA